MHKEAKPSILVTITSNDFHSTLSLLSICQNHSINICLNYNLQTWIKIGEENLVEWKVMDIKRKVTLGKVPTHTVAWTRSRKERDKQKTRRTKFDGQLSCFSMPMDCGINKEGWKTKDQQVINWYSFTLKIFPQIATVESWFKQHCLFKVTPLEVTLLTCIFKSSVTKSAKHMLWER